MRQMQSESRNETRRVETFLHRLLIAGGGCILLKYVGVPERVCITGLVAAAVVIGVTFIVNEIRGR